MPDPAPDTITITELGERTGKASSALRYYEREHLLRPSGRVGGRRVYPVRAIEQVALIDLLQVAGLTIGEIRAIVSPIGVFAEDWREQARQKIEHIERQLGELQLAKSILEHTVDCPHGALEECPTFQRGVHDHAVALASAFCDQP
jgi:MerR family transcriptional regulator, redox-sensitive transcriptional activator SoxR